MNHSVSQAAFPHEAKVRLLRSERKAENNQPGQLKIKLHATANAKESEVWAFQNRHHDWGEVT